MKSSTKNTILFLLFLLIAIFGVSMIFTDRIENFKKTAVKFTDNSIIFNSFSTKSNVVVYCSDRVIRNIALEIDNSLFIEKKEFKQGEICHAVYNILGFDVKIPLDLDLTPPIIQDNIPVFTKKDHVEGKVFSNEVGTIKIIGEAMEFASYDSNVLHAQIPLNKGLNYFNIVVKDKFFNTTEKPLKIYRE